MLLNLNTW